jgi:hypothetical protein
MRVTGFRRGELAGLLDHSIGKGTADRFEAQALDAIFEQGRGTPALLVAFVESCLKAHPQGTISAEQVAAVLDRIEAT